jgi:DoxX-like family
MNIVLWIVQVLLAALFGFAGSMKWIMSVEAMNAQSPIQLPGLLLHFIGTCEVLGALGLILPGLLRIRTGLTPLAAAGLTIIVIGATVITIMGGQIPGAALPFVAALLAAFVAYFRWRVVPLRGRN